MRSAVEWAQVRAMAARRDPHDTLATNQQEPLEGARDVAAVLQRPHPLGAKPARPIHHRGEAALADVDGLVAEQLVIDALAVARAALREGIDRLPVAELAGVELDTYIDRKRAEGKTHRDAIRCLKRHLARRIWHLLQPPTPATPTPAPSTA